LKKSAQEEIYKVNLMVKIRYKKLLVFFVLVILNLILFNFSAQAVLVPCGGYATPDPGMCTLCHLIVGIKGIIDYAFLIFVALALVMLVISGIMYIVSAGNSGMMESAKGLMKNVLVGFALVLLAWLIINTTMLVIGARGDLGIGVQSWHTFNCNTASSANSGAEASGSVGSGSRGELNAGVSR